MDKLRITINLTTPRDISEIDAREYMNIFSQVLQKLNITHKAHWEVEKKMTVLKVRYPKKKGERRRIGAKR